jgi:hypothetical protein
MTLDLREFEGADERIELRQALIRTQQQLRRAKAKVEDLVEATQVGAKDAMIALGPVQPVKPPKTDRRKGKAEVALWHLTDWQGTKVTTSYNSQLMRDRIMRFCDVAGEITEIQRTHHPVKRCVIMFGGDMMEGLFNYPAQSWEIDGSLFDQYARVSRLQVDVVRRALSMYEQVEVVGEYGNHGRLGSKRAEIPRADNMDRMVQHLAREMTLDEPRLSWRPPSAEDMQRIEIGNYRALLIHGDEIGRNGYASPMTIVNHVAKWQSGSYPWAFRDCFMGHFHNHCEWALPNGQGALYQTGAPESDNRYAMVGMASSATPSQRLHFVEPVKGRTTGQYKVHLDS